MGKWGSGHWHRSAPSRPGTDPLLEHDRLNNDGPSTEHSSNDKPRSSRPEQRARRTPVAIQQESGNLPRFVEPGFTSCENQFCYLRSPDGLLPELTSKE
ncbi:unnamed protein product [Gongylonema pulchrum]|uniref:Protein Nef n=1 Tax=Gongylonema pulchrum TaxID=637853 RepID=A0A183E385_9BILA|nr:unnamed protein product [Gongylonema pulchrum]